MGHFEITWFGILNKFQIKSSVLQCKDLDLYSSTTLLNTYIHRFSAEKSCLGLLFYSLKNMFLHLNDAHLKVKHHTRSLSVLWKWTLCGFICWFQRKLIGHFLPDAIHILSEVHQKFFRVKQPGWGNEALTVSDIKHRQLQCFCAASWLTRTGTETVEVCETLHACVDVSCVSERALMKWPAKYIKRRPIHSAS